MKNKREIIYAKYGGKCAYCGEALQKGWHIDHIVPILRGHQRNRELDSIDNLNPSCASCNINKHQLSVEQFRRLIQGFTRHLNAVSTQYKIAKRYGLIAETDGLVTFYFEEQQP